MPPKLSIAIPTYNRVEYLQQLLPDLVAQAEHINQNGDVVEILLIDNASEDNIRNYVQSDFSGVVRHYWLYKIINCQLSRKANILMNFLQELRK